MMEGFQKFFSKKDKTKKYGYDSEYDDIDTDAEDMFMDESYMDSEEVKDEFFD